MSKSGFDLVTEIFKMLFFRNVW